MGKPCGLQREEAVAAPCTGQNSSVYAVPARWGKRSFLLAPPLLVPPARPQSVSLGALPAPCPTAFGAHAMKSCRPAWGDPVRLKPVTPFHVPGDALRLR